MRVNRSVLERSRYTDVLGWVPFTRSDCPWVGPFYALSTRPPDRILVIDEDQGKSGATAEGRLGFRRLLAEVGLDHVELILGYASYEPHLARPGTISG